MTEDTKDTIVLTKAQYENMIGRLEAIEGKQAPKPKSPDKKVATVMLLDGCPIVEFGNLETIEKQDDKGNTSFAAATEISVVILNKEGKKETKKTNYRGLVEYGKRVSVEIVKSDKKLVEKPQGSIPQTIITSPSDPVGLRQKDEHFMPERVELTQTIPEVISTVKFIDGEYEGKTLTLNNNSLNR